MHRFFVTKESIVGQEVRFDRQQAHQIHSVLRFQAGRRVIVLDNTGSEYEVELTVVGRHESAGAVVEKRRTAGEPSVRITLFQAMLARDKFEWVLQKGTEVGVSRFVPVITERTVVRQSRTKADKLVRWRRIVTEAAEQSRRGVIPSLDEPIRLGRALTELPAFDCGIIAYEAEHHASLRQVLGERDGRLGSIAVFIGPEGGFTEDEVRGGCEQGASAVSLGPRILRTETAAIVTVSLILHELGQMQY